MTPLRRCRCQRAPTSRGTPDVLCALVRGPPRPELATVPQHHERLRHPYRVHLVLLAEELHEEGLLVPPAQPDLVELPPEVLHAVPGVEVDRRGTAPRVLQQRHLVLQQHRLPQRPEPQRLLPVLEQLHEEVHRPPRRRVVEVSVRLVVDQNLPRHVRHRQPALAKVEVWGPRVLPPLEEEEERELRPVHEAVESDLLREDREGEEPEVRKRERHPKPPRPSGQKV